MKNPDTRSVKVDNFDSKKDGKKGSNTLNSGNDIKHTEQNTSCEILADLFNKMPQLSPETLQDTNLSLKEHLQDVERHLDFKVDAVSGRLVINVIESQSKKVIRQIPPPALVEIAQRFGKSGNVSKFTHPSDKQKD
jgi:uncharacterized FlaG/YvyC family protein